MPSSIAFVPEPLGPEDPEVIAVVPVIDAARLTDLIHAFEREAGYEQRETSYAGLVPAYANFGSAASHYMPGDGGARIPLLGCECGEWGCWPLMARVAVEGDEVRWAGFEQPFRPQRDYSGFGPFAFRRYEYAAAVERAWPGS